MAARRPRRNRWRVVALGAIGIVLVLGLVVQMSRSRRAPSPDDTAAATLTASDPAPPVVLQATDGTTVLAFTGDTMFAFGWQERMSDSITRPSGGRERVEDVACLERDVEPAGTEPGTAHADLQRPVVGAGYTDEQPRELVGVALAER